MNVSIKNFSVNMSIKTKGIELDVYDGKNAHLGDLIVNSSGLTWCKGRTTRAKGVKVSWKQFIDRMEG